MSDDDDKTSDEKRDDAEEANEGESAERRVADPFGLTGLHQTLKQVDESLRAAQPELEQIAEQRGQVAEAVQATRFPAVDMTSQMRPMHEAISTLQQTDALYMDAATMVSLRDLTRTYRVAIEPIRIQLAEFPLQQISELLAEFRQTQKITFEQAATLGSAVQAVGSNTGYASTRLSKSTYGFDENPAEDIDLTKDVHSDSSTKLVYNPLLVVYVSIYDTVQDDTKRRRVCTIIGYVLAVMWTSNLLPVFALPTISGLRILADELVEALPEPTQRP